jgi:hypothetical protein
VELARDGDYTVSLHPGEFRRMSGTVEPLSEDLLQGSKGRSMPGSHRPEGVYVISSASGLDAGAPGPVTQESIAPIVLELAGFRIPGYFDAEPGRLTSGKLEWLDRRTLYDSFHGAKERSRSSAPPRDEEAEQAVKKRLEDLGYL